LFFKLLKAIKNTIKKNIIFTWILSYLIIMLLSMASNGIIYYRAKNAIKDELTKNSIAATEKFKISVDNIFVNTSNIAKRLYNDDDIIRLYNTPADVPYINYSGDALSVASKLQSILNANPYLSEIYIYYKNIDLVTGSHYMYTKNIFYERTFKDSDLSYEEWTSLFDKNSYAVPKLISHSDGEKQTVDIFYQIPEFLDKFHAVAVLSVDTATLLNNAKAVTDMYSETGMFILSKDNEVIMTNGVVESVPESSDDCIVIDTVSDTIGWHYVSVIPSEIFEKKLTYFRLINIFNIIIFLIVCGVLSYFFAKRNARPFLSFKLIYNNEDENEDDMTLINDVLNDYRSAKKTQSELEQSHLMEELISTGKPEILDELKKNKIDFPYQYFCVILFKLVNVSRLFENEKDVSTLHKYDSVMLIIKNVLEEIINEKHCSYICKINGQIVAVVNINHDLLVDFRSDLESMLNRGQEFISAHFAFSYTPFVGGIHDVKALHKSYTEAINALQYRTFIPATDIVFSEDTIAVAGSSDATAIIPAERKKQLINILQLRDVEASLSMVNSLFAAAPHDSPSKYRIFLFDLISTIIRAVESTGNDDIETELSDELCTLTGNCDTSAVPEKLSEIISEFCLHGAQGNAADEAKETGNNLSKKDIVEEIKRFIGENYTNQSLNIAMVGDYFNITPYYVSNLFKKSEKVGMLDYISKIRIEKAKELIVTTDLTLESIALKCGFSNIRTFMRVFQKFEVITPGKYKEINKT